MAAKLTKAQRAHLRKKHKERKIRKYESQDARGISRKKWKFTYSPKRFIWAKSILIVLIPIFYVIYSPLLVVVMIAYIGLFFLAIGTERQLNKSVIKSNHIKIPKFDSALALILVTISLFGSIFGVSQGRPGRFTNTFSSKIMSGLNNFGSLLTGNRQLFGSIRSFGFGTMPEPPDGFIAHARDFAQMNPDMRPMGGGRPDFNLDMSDLPIEFMFSQILSTIQTVLIFIVVGIGIISLILTIRKIKKFETDINEIIVDQPIMALSPEIIDHVLTFGEVEESYDDA